ncbi:hypothetical protein Tco_0653759 [Tanacetum coccineum]|uniref:Reverse transcriptase domain-containing protein n=1 Tax=Tanacetum coccineum TaxID=301880 RepID=A0ABQ4X236_9ASTR
MLTLRYFTSHFSDEDSRNVPNTSVKLMAFPFSLEGAGPDMARKKEPSRSIETSWDDLTFMRLGIVFNDLLRDALIMGFQIASTLIHSILPNLNSIKIIELCCLVNPHANSQKQFQRGNNFNQNRGNNFNQGQIYRPPVNHPVTNQPAAHQGLAPQTHGVSKTDFERYVTANDAVLRNMQNQGQNLQSQMANLTDMLSKFVTANTASTSGSGTLPGNTVTNPKEDLKGHDAPANNEAPKTSNLLLFKIQSVITNPEPNVAPVVTPVPKASIPFPSRRNDERRKEKANDQIEKFYEIFRDLSFEISFTDALMLMPKFASTLKTLIGYKEKLEANLQELL